MAEQPLPPIDQPPGGTSVPRPPTAGPRPATTAPTTSFKAQFNRALATALPGARGAAVPGQLTDRPDTLGSLIRWFAALPTSVAGPRAPARESAMALQSRANGPHASALSGTTAPEPARAAAGRGVEVAAAARPDGSRPMALAEFPKPPGDNGRGMHWVPTVFSPTHTVDRFVKEMVDMKVKWAVILNDGTSVGQNDYLVKKLVDNGIMPVMRVYTPNGAPIQGDLQAMVRHYRALGVSYFQLYNEPNLMVENEGRRPDPDRYLDLWVPAAKAVVQAGGLPGFGALAPGGNYDDVEFLKKALDGLKARGETRVLDRAWLSLHNYTLNHPLDYTKDSNGFLKFRFYDQVVREKLGRSLPIVGTEGGTHVGVRDDKTLPSITESRQVDMVRGAYEYMRRAEPYFFAYTYWIIANEEGGGRDPAFSSQALFKPGQTSPVVEALRKLA